MRRFFVPAERMTADRVRLPPDESHHLAAVLRMAPGQVIEVFDGRGGLYQVRLLTVSPRQVTGQVLARLQLPPPPPFPLILAQPLLKGKKMDLIIQKATELGVDRLIPLVTRYSQTQGKALQRRWQRIMVAACKQSRRPCFMEITPPLSLTELNMLPYPYRILLWEREQHTSLHSLCLDKPGPILLISGPEGGLHSEEVARCRSGGCLCVTLGRQVLRAETASIAAIAIIQFLGTCWKPTGKS